MQAFRVAALNTIYQEHMTFPGICSCSWPMFMLMTSLMSHIDHRSNQDAERPWPIQHMQGKGGLLLPLQGRSGSAAGAAASLYCCA